MSVLASVAGITLIAIAARDVFDTLFHPHGRGVVSEALIRAAWRALRWMSRRRAALLSLAGPIGFLLVVLSWITLVVAGGALIVLPQLPERYALSPGLGPDSVTGLGGAIYVSLVNLTSLGYGDVVARTDALRLLGPLQAIIGLGILTASISWILSIYKVLGDYRSLAREIGLVCDAAEATGHSLARMGADSAASVMAGLTSQLVAVRGDILHFPIVYYFHSRDPRDDPARSLERLIPALEECRETHREPAAALEAERLALAIRDLLTTVDGEFLGAAGTPPRETLARWQRDHLWGAD